MKLLLTIVLLASAWASDIVCPGGQYKCPDDTSCCQLPNLTYGCCPMPNAVCCTDHIHCCPEGNKCDGGMCIQSDLFNMTGDLSENDQKHLCPGDRYSCPDDSTCCESPDGGAYGCCLLPGAICCEDGQHCCPQNTKCDLTKSLCVGKEFATQMYDAHKEVNKPKEHGLIELTEFTSIAKRVASVVCPDGSYQCPDGYTCCKMPSGQWGCCPFDNAVCCNDHLHCCPSNMKCDSTSQSCLQGIQNITWSKNKPAERVTTTDIICPDKGFKCPDTSTCCELESGGWGCCPYENATCCSDHQHCCPEELVCDVIHRQCKRGLFKTPWQKKFKAKPVQPVVDYI